MKKLTRILRRNHIAAAITLTLGSLSPVWADESAKSFVEMVEKVALAAAMWLRRRMRVSFFIQPGPV